MTPEQFNEICIEYVAAPDDHAWDKGHPIFCLAEENDSLKRSICDMRAYLKSRKATNGNSHWENFVGLNPLTRVLE